MWATTKYVSVTCQSKGKAARKIPESPPIVKTATAPSAKSIGVSRITFPRQVVAVQLKILIPVGRALVTEESMEKMLSALCIPTENRGFAKTSVEEQPVQAAERDI